MKVCVHVVVLFFAAAVTFIFVGCGGDGDGVYPSSGGYGSKETPAEEAAREKSDQAMSQVRQQRTAIQMTAEETGDFSLVVVNMNKVLREVCDIDSKTLDYLFELYIDHTPIVGNPTKGWKIQQFLDLNLTKLESGQFFQFYLEYTGYLDPLLQEYLRLHFLYTDAGKGELIELYIEEIRRGEVNVTFPKNL